MPLSKSAKYYRENPAARRRKQATDARINRRPEQVRKRVESNAKRREAKAAGKNIKGRDYDHATRRFTSIRANRGRRGEGNR